MQKRRRRVDFTNSWMFGRVMTDESICRDVIRAVLGIEAVRVEYLNAEQVLDPSPEVPELRLGDASHWLALNARAWEDAPGGDLLDLLRYAQTGKALGSLSRKIEAAVGRSNEDRGWVDKVWSVSTIVENAARRERINGRIACEEAREEGRQEGRQEGREEGSARFAALASRLIEAGRVDDLAQAASDPARRDELFRELGV